MDKKENNSFNEKKSMLEYRKWIEEIEHNVSQREHWKAQRFFWICVALIALLSVTAQFYAPIFKTELDRQYELNLKALENNKAMK